MCPDRTSPRPRKSLGQHFLTDAHTAHVLVERGRIGSGTRVLEVGPGQGFLTRHLLEAGAQVVAVEKDEALARGLCPPCPPTTCGFAAGTAPEAAGGQSLRDRPFLPTHSFGGRSAEGTAESQGTSPPPPTGAVARAQRGPVGGRTLAVLSADFLSLDLSPFSGFVLVGNLPYYVSLPILRRALDFGALWPRMVFMFQLEVAQRIVADPGSRDFGLPSIMVALTHGPSLVRRVPAGAFFPRPKVDSALVLFEPKPLPLLTGDARERFLEFISAAFRFRRKTALNALATAHAAHAGSSTGPRIPVSPEPTARSGSACRQDSAVLRGCFAAAGLEPSVRLEQLAVADLIMLWKEVERCWRMPAQLLLDGP